jgi:hypothetical protein
MGRFPFPILWWNMPHFSWRWKPSPLQAHWGRWHHTHLLWPACLFTIHVRECPSSSLRSTGHPVFFVMCLVFFFQLLVYYSIFFLFSLGRGQSVQGAMLICPREYHVLLICSPGGLPSRVGAGVWRHGSPPGFSI